MVLGMLFAIVLSSMIASSVAQIPGTGPCKEIKPMTNFDPTKVLGQWYGYAAFPDCEPHGRCRRTEFIDNHDGTMEFITKQISTVRGLPLVRPNQVYHGLERGVYIGNATYVLTKPDDAWFVNVTVTFWNTDYVSYVIKGTCRNAGPSSLYYVWVITRSPNPSKSVVEKIEEALDADGFPKEYLIKFNQTDCAIEY